MELIKSVEIVSYSKNFVKAKFAAIDILYCINDTFCSINESTFPKQISHIKGINIKYVIQYITRIHGYSESQVVLSSTTVLRV